MLHRSALLVPLAFVACQAAPEAPEEPVATDPALPSVSEGKVPSADGVPIAYAVEGEGRSTVVLLHGWSCDRSYWRGQIEALSADYRVVTIDLAGHGASGVDRADWTLAAFGQDVKAVVEELGLARVVLVGHSMGAATALEAARLLGDRALGVVAVDALHDVGSRPDPEGWGRLMESYETDFAGTCDRFVHSLFLETADSALVESTATDMCTAPAEVATAIMRGFGAYDQAAVMGAAGVPIRAINSAMFPTNVEGNRRYAEDFEITVLEGVGHFPMLVKPEQLNRRLLEILAELTAS